MRPTVLVVTTVHWPDDTRIRERLIRTLSSDFEVDYAARTPGPSDDSNLTWIPLLGGRLRRALTALRLAVTRQWDVLVIHDPELLPVAWAAALRRRPVVFDVHENIPAIALTRPWVPNYLRRPLERALRIVLRISERRLRLTLAEYDYAALFTSDHPVFPNFPDTAHYPDPAMGERFVVYLGDVTAERGSLVAIRACALADVPLKLIGRVNPNHRIELNDAIRGGQQVSFLGQTPNPEALELARGAGVGISPLLDTPNYRHSAPTKILEYLALGLPVVASDLKGTRDLVEGLDAVELVPPGDAAALAQSILDCLHDPNVRAAAAGQVDLVRNRFSWPRAEVSKFYRALVRR